MSLAEKQNSRQASSLLHAPAAKLRLRQNSRLSHLVFSSRARRQRTILRALRRLESNRGSLGAAPTKRIPDRNSGRRSEFLYQFSRRPFALREFPAAEIHSLHQAPLQDCGRSLERGIGGISMGGFGALRL